MSNTIMGSQKMKLLNAMEAAQMLRVSLPTIRLWIAARKLPVVRLGRRVLIEESALEAIIEAARCPARDSREMNA